MRQRPSRDNTVIKGRNRLDSRLRRMDRRRRDEGSNRVNYRSASSSVFIFGLFSVLCGLIILSSTLLSTKRRISLPFQLQFESIEQEPNMPDTPRSTHKLRIVSFNVAGADPSQVAPSTWTQSDQDSAIRDEILRNDPNIIMLQECPDSQSWASTLFGDSFTFVGSTPSHAGWVALLLRNDVESFRRISLPRNLPIVGAQVTVQPNISLIVASSHLAPFLGGSSRRKSQLQAFLESDSTITAMKDASTIIVGGDMNMRDTEDATIEGKLGLVDFWKLAGSKEQTKFSWDTVDHRKESKDGSFNQYYGRDTRQYQKRYDRFYGSKAGQDRWRVSSFELFANKPIPPSSKQFLSDHFGMATEIEWSVASPN